jgi:hypothetical protein
MAGLIWVAYVTVGTLVRSRVCSVIHVNYHPSV